MRPRPQPSPPFWQAVAQFRKHDSDGDGVLEYAEFAALVRGLTSGAGGARYDQMQLRAAFHRLDSDHSRTIDLAEYMKLMQPPSGGAPLEAVRSNHGGGWMMMMIGGCILVCSSGV